MDFKNLCQKIDVDSLKARIPPMPPMPQMPQIKLPKSIPKLKSRKIFKSSRENVSAASPKHGQTPPPIQTIPPPIPHSNIINRTPTRISTISSLMHQHVAYEQNRDRDLRHQSTYRSANSIDDDYPSPTQYAGRSGSRPITPVRTSVGSIDIPTHSTSQDVAGSASNVKMSITEKLQKGYKDISEFRIKHIFAKKTIVRKDGIVVDNYVQSYEEDLRVEARRQEERDRNIASSYRFKFKVSRQNTGHTNSIDSNDSAVSEPQPHQQQTGKSDDESGMEGSPPTHKPGIAATRFSKVRNPPLRQSSSEHSNLNLNENEIAISMPEPNQSTLWSIKENRTPVEATSPATSRTETATQEKPITKLQSYKQRIRRLKSYISSHDESSGDEVQGQRAENETIAKSKESKTEKLTARLKKFKSRGVTTNADNNNTGNDTDNDSPKHEKAASSRTERFTARLRRFRSRDAATATDTEQASPSEAEQNTTTTVATTSKSPVRAISNKFQNWKKSFKKKQPAAEPTEPNTGDESSPERQREEKEAREKPTRTGTLIKKLKHMRARKQPNSSQDDLDAAATDDEQVAAGTAASTTRSKRANLEEKFQQARKRTLKKVDETMQQMKNMKFFQKSQENVNKEQNTSKTAQNRQESEEEDNDDDNMDKQYAGNVHPSIARRNFQDVYHSDDPDEYEQDDAELPTTAHKAREDYASAKVRAAWTTRSIHSESVESDTDVECPRLLIHQDNSDLFESTLIIAVTRPVPTPTTISPALKICEIPVDVPVIKTKSSPPAKPVAWIPNKEIVAGFLEITPPLSGRRKMSADAIIQPPARTQTRKRSLDSNADTDTAWIPTENMRHEQRKLQQQQQQMEHTKDTTRRASTAGLNSINENEEPWKVQTKLREEKIYKTKSIDIFEMTARQGGVSAAFKDFDDELKNAPIMKITADSVDNFERESSEDPDAADDDNSSRVTKIAVNAINCNNGTNEINQQVATTTTATENEQQTQIAENQLRQQIGNSSESLIANIDEEGGETDSDDRPPSAPPSPPPASALPPPPVPQRQPSMRLSKDKVPSVLLQPQQKSSQKQQSQDEAPASPPPLPSTKPPLPPHKPPPKIPQRAASTTTRVSRPLVKTSSLRLAYSEQVKPSDVGKVNKLISRFEQPQPQQGKVIERPRVVKRKVWRDDSTDYSDEEEQFAAKQRNILERDTTPTPTNTPITGSLDIEENTKTIHHTTAAHSVECNKNIIIASSSLTDLIIDKENNAIQMQTKLEQQITTNSITDNIVPKLTLNFDSNSNYGSISCPNSEYGSPLEYPSSLMGSTETTPVPDRKQQQQQHELRIAGRSRRSVPRDAESFYSFDSDEENSYYSISPSGSSRYIVEI